MGPFRVGNLSFTMATAAAGQSFTPDVAGPGGSGSPGTANTVSALSIIVGYNSELDPRADCCYLLSELAEDPMDPSDDPNLLGTTNTRHDGSAFGSGSFTTTYVFPQPIQLDPSQTYYLYFGGLCYLRCNSPSDYSGGTLIDEFNDPLDQTAQFLVQLTC